MKNILFRGILSGCLAGITLGEIAPAQAASAVIEVQRSLDAVTWEKVPLDPTQLTVTGALLQNTHEPQALYRLSIQDGENAGFLTALPLDEAPAEAVAVAEQFLRELLIEDEESEGGDAEGGWGNVQLGPVCYPVYDPSVESGKTPAYIEFKVVRAVSPKPAPPAEDPFGMSPPDTTNNDCDFGHLLVALTRGDFPVPSFSQTGPTPVEMLLRKSRTSGPIKPVRFDDGLLVAEDPNGNLVGSIGNEPFFIDPKILEIAGKEFEGVDNENGTQDDEGPEFPIGAYASYREFKADFAENPLYAELRRLRAEQAAGEWNAVLGIEPEVLRVTLNQRELVLDDREIQSAFVADEKIAAVNPSTGTTGVLITGQLDGGTLLTVIYPNGTQESFLLVVGQGGRAARVALNAQHAGWTSWKYWYAGNWGDQRRYQQYLNDSQMCTSGASGCGPAAWAMLYGWWDRKGSPRLIKNTGQADAPLYNDDSVRDCNRYVFDQVGPFCVNGQAATMPWNMKWGYRWAQHRGAGRDITWTWGVPYLSPGSVSKVANSIKAGRPSILGLGFYWHYPLAYGYKVREYRSLGITWSVQRYFKCNMGWGGNSPQWQNASSTWFGTHARYW